jgi:hypothetical protein
MALHSKARHKERARAVVALRWTWTGHEAIAEQAEAVDPAMLAEQVEVDQVSGWAL